MLFDRLWYPLSILLVAAIGAKLIGPHGGLQFGKQKVVKSNGLRGLILIKNVYDFFGITLLTVYRGASIWMSTC